MQGHSQGSAFNQTGLAITTLGKMCFDISNHLESETMSRSEIQSMLDWIGSSVDVETLKTFFSQEAPTIRAIWESLNSKAQAFRHEAALNALLSVHLSIHQLTQKPWTLGRLIHFQHHVAIDPRLTPSLVDASAHPKWELDDLLCAALRRGSPTGVLKSLVSVGARLTDSGPYRDIMTTVIAHSRIREDQNLDTIDIDLLHILLEAGAVVDDPSLDYTGFSWRGPNKPAYTTDRILLNEAQYTPRASHPWSLIFPFSNRQQTTVTVPGVFEAIQGGQCRLHSYLEARLEPKDDLRRRQALEVALSEASARGYTEVAQGLMQFGVDSNVRTLPNLGNGSWHPIVRAANAGQTDTLRLLTAATNIDFSPPNEVLGNLDLRLLQTMGIPKRDEVLRALSRLKFETAARRKILLNAIGSNSCVCHSLPCGKCGQHIPDFEFVDQLLRHGLACVDRTEDLDGETPPILLRAIQQNCSTRAFHYLVEPDVGIVSNLSGKAMAPLVEATLKYHSSPSKILKFFAQKNERFQSDVQKNARYILGRLLRERDCAYPHRFCCGREPEKDCECVIIVKWCLDLGVSLESNYGSFLADLMEHASSDSFVLEAIRRGAELNVADQVGRTALQKSIKRGRLQLAVALIERGSDINAPAAPYHRTALQEACYTGAPLWFINFVLDNGADINAPPASERGYTALQAACGSGAQLSCINLLLKRGAAVNAPPAAAYGMTALQCAARRGYMNVVGLLLDHGADVNALSGYRLRLSVSRYGMAPTSKFEGFMRALDLAALASRLDMVHFLIAAGGRSYRPGRTGFDGAIELATSEGHFAVADLLRQYPELTSENISQAETEWLRANPQADMHDGCVVPAGLVPFIKRGAGDTEAGLKEYMQMNLSISQES